MKKFFMYIVLINFIPYIFIYFFGNNSVIITEKEKYIEKNMISLYKVKENITVDIEFEEYIKGVTYAEMPASFEIEALKAQAVAARTYTYRKIGQNTHKNGDICDDPLHCQAFREKDTNNNYEKVSTAVDLTKGEIITYNGEVINALFHASSGGKTEDVAEVWNSNKIEYLSSVESPGEEEIMKDFITEKIINKEEFLTKLKLFDSDLKYDGNIKILSKTVGERVEKLKVGNKEISGTKMRNIFDLRSSNFEIKPEENSIKFIVKGYGHGVGLSQWGAQAMALKGGNYKDILTHYYAGTQVETVI